MGETEYKTPCGGSGSWVCCRTSSCPVDNFTHPVASHSPLFTRSRIPSVPGRPLEHQGKVVSIPAVLLLTDTNPMSLQSPRTSRGICLYASLWSSESSPTSKIFPPIMDFFHLFSSPLPSLQDHWFFLGMLLFCLFSELQVPSFPNLISLYAEQSSLSA